jgi:hypothetical protein
MPATTTELERLATLIKAPAPTRRLAARASTSGTPGSALRARASLMGVPSLMAKLLPESGSACTPICLESIEESPPEYYLGTNSAGLAGIWPLAAAGGVVEEAPSNGVVYGRRDANWFPISLYFPATPGPANPNGLYAGAAKGLMYSQLDPTLAYVMRIWTFDGIVGETTGWK